MEKWSCSAGSGDREPSPNPCGNFTFDPGTHVYTLARVPLLSVTDVLRDNGWLDPRWFTEEARSRGRAVHVACHYADLGRLDWATLHPDLHGYVRSWAAYKAEARLEILDIEVPRYHPLFRFAGTLDRRVVMYGHEWILDFKTGRAPKAGRYQTAAYDLLAPPAPKLRKKACLELQADGSVAKLVPYNEDKHRHDGNRFIAFLTTTQARIEAGIQGDHAHGD